ncbi:MAG TPA: hypothetical protein VFQ15_03545 [Jiangellaceae bacterium]|nr:hypothetical protein [Jiangellaceae bacterium]
MARYRITAPVPNVVSTIAGVAFADSTGETDAPAALAYFRRHGYGVEEIVSPTVADPPPAEPAPAAPDGPVKKPAKSASKADWVSYAVTQGVPTEDAETLTRDQLAERFADPSGDQS